MRVNLGVVELLPEVITAIRESYRCPVCRSLVQVKGIPDATVGDLQDLYCPVCTQQWWFSSWRERRLFIWELLVPIPTTYKWYVEKVLERGPEPIPKPVPTSRPPVGGGWPGVKKQVWQDYKKIAFYGFLILAGLIAVKQGIKKILK